MSIPKATSFEYGRDYQLQQADKFRNRKTNAWAKRIQLAFDLVGQHSLPRLQGKAREEIVVVDIGCSIGTFATEFAMRGYRSYGIDFDSSALEIARGLAREMNASPQFVCGDVATWSDSFPSIDTAICFDIFEHLHDDELGAFLAGIRRQMNEDGTIIFHTYPTEYDYLFYGKKWRLIPLLLFTWLPAAWFERFARSFACLYDMLLLLTRGMTYRETIKREGHCNPLTRQRLKDILSRAGFDLLDLQAADLYSDKASIRRRTKAFTKHSIAKMNLYGAAAVKSI